MAEPPEPYVFTRRGRSWRLVILLGVIYAALIAAIVALDAAWWLVAALALTTLPALWDLYGDPVAGIRLGDSRLEWRSGRHHGALGLDEIDHVRMDTRWDFSVRVTAMLGGRQRVRLPYDALPAHRSLEAALQARGIRVERHHFTVF